MAYPRPDYPYKLNTTFLWHVDIVVASGSDFYFENTI